jgi:hypothetical protein
MSRILKLKEGGKEEGIKRGLSALHSAETAEKPYPMNVFYRQLARKKQAAIEMDVAQSYSQIDSSL